MTIAVYWDVKHQIKKKKKKKKTFIYMYDSRTMCTYARVVCGNKKMNYECSTCILFQCCFI